MGTSWWPYFISFIILTFCPSSFLCFEQRLRRILLIGDSLDRLIVADYCTYRDGRFSKWGDASIKYGGQDGTKMPSALCEESVKAIHDNNTFYNNSIAFFHIFNSAARGPYLWIDHRDPYSHSEPRINKAVELYKAQVGEPTEVIFQSELWDARPHIVYEQLNRTSNNHWEEVLSEFRSNVIARVNQIKKLFAASVTVGLRTCPWTPYGGDLLKEFNEIVRNITISEKLLLYDYHKDVWGPVSYNYSAENLAAMFRDSHHPVERFSLYAAEKLLGYRFSSNLIHPNRSDDETEKEADIDIIYHQNRSDNVFFGFIKFLDSGNLSSTGFMMGVNYTNIFYSELSHDGIHIWSNFPPAFSRAFYFSEEDVLILNSPTHSRWPIIFEGDFYRNNSDIRAAIERVYSAPRVGVNCSDGVFYIIRDGYMRFVNISRDPSMSFMPYLHVPVVVSGVDYFYIKHYLPGRHIPLEYYAENSLIRMHNERQVYLITNGTKHPVMSGKAFFSHGWEFDWVKEVPLSYKKDVNEMASGLEISR